MKRQMKRILFIEFLILVVYLGLVMLNKDDYQGRINVSLNQWASDYAAYENSEWYIKDGWIEDGKQVTFLHGPIIAMDEGDYTATICYETEKDQQCQPYVYKTNKGYLKCNVATLEKESNIMSFDFKVTEDIDNSQLKSTEKNP